MSIQGIYRNLPEPVIRDLLKKGLLRQPSEITDSAEGALMLPEFATIEEFEQLIARIDEVSHEVAAELSREAEKLRQNGRNGRNGDHASGT